MTTVIQDGVRISCFLAHKYIGFGLVIVRNAMALSGLLVRHMTKISSQLELYSHIKLLKRLILTPFGGHFRAILI